MNKDERSKNFSIIPRRKKRRLKTFQRFAGNWRGVYNPGKPVSPPTRFYSSNPDCGRIYRQKKNTQDNVSGEGEIVPF